MQQNESKSNEFVGELPHMDTATAKYLILKNHNKTLRDLDREWGLSIGTVSMVLNRDYRIVRPDVRLKLAELLGVDVSQIGRESKRPKSVAYNEQGERIQGRSS